MVKRFFCFVSWHSFFSGYELVRSYKNDPYGIANKYKCKWCDFTGLVDSQGNIF